HGQPIWTFPPRLPKLERIESAPLARPPSGPVRARRAAPGQRTTDNGQRTNKDMPPKFCLPFEKEIYAMEDLLAQLEAGANGQLGGGDEVRRVRRELTNLKRKIYSDLQPWQTVLVSRHPERPQLLDYLDLIFDEF